MLLLSTNMIHLLLLILIIQVAWIFFKILFEKVMLTCGKMPVPLRIISWFGRVSANPMQCKQPFASIREGLVTSINLVGDLVTG